MRQPTRFVRWILRTRVVDPVDVQQVQLLQVFLLIMIGATFVSAPVFLLLEDYPTGLVVVIGQTVVVLWSLGAFIAIRTGHLYRGIELTTAGMLGAFTFVLVYMGLPQGNAFLIAFVFPLCMSGLLGTRRFLFIVAASGIGLVLLTSIIHPLIRVTPDVPAVQDFAVYAVITFSVVTIGVTIFLDRVGSVLRTALQASLGREQELARISAVLTSRTEALEAELQYRQVMQAQLVHAQRMESIGYLASGVAHDFNNLLSVILTCTQFAQQALPPTSEVQADLHDIEQAGWRATALTRQLLTFAQKQPMDRTRIRVNDLIREIQPLIHRILGEVILLRLELTPDLGVIQGDARQLEQVFLNLASNAHDAMPHGGTVTLATASVVVDSALTMISLSPGAYVQITVTDTGMGMDTTTQQWIFEPFFTTKGPDKGTGLGLSTVYGVVKEHKGGILCVSAVDEGTTFTIYLPQDGDVVMPAEML